MVARKRPENPFTRIMWTILVLSCPTYAHGEDAVILIGIEIIIILLLISLILAAKLNFIGKVICIFTCFFGVVISNGVTWKMAFDDNQLLISILSLLSPVAFSFVSFLAVKNKFRKDLPVPDKYSGINI